ncbi:FtsX-like permease family protein [Actinoplanes sp. NPDC051346]|uniref:FtsX-like permease family protein n=1 Tax=Actinoplanes sp. NPDC051346 TaxID=3155048 RepID=UPI00344AE3EF
MSLVLRRARAARSLLLAAAGVALIATTLLTSLAAYSREVVAAGTRGAIASAAPDERSVLVRGSAGRTADDLAKRDSILRARVGASLPDRPVDISAAGYATGRELSGATGNAVPDAGGVVYGSIVFLEGLDRHAVLSAGAWPRPGSATMETVLAESVASILRVKVGDTIPVTDRVTSRASHLRVVGIWRPRDLRDPYWLLTPDVATGMTPRSATYGPIVIDRADFGAGFSGNASAGWLVAMETEGADVADIARMADAADELTTALPQAAGLGTSGLVNTQIGALGEKLARADLVGRSALVTPMLLIAILSGLALVLVAALLIDHRRGESALLRARGAARIQLAGLAAREALLVVVPAAVVAPLLAVVAVTLAGATLGGPVKAPPIALPDPLLWLVAAAAAIGCAVAITAPALRGGGTYVAEMAGRSRPGRRTAVQRIGLDLALVGLAVLGWFQLQQYASPVTGSRSDALGIDPFLAAAPTLGVLAGATLALRLLPPVARFGERSVDGKPWPGTVFGMWQAGRRPHAGPVLLLALAVAAGTVAWCLAGTSVHSIPDQADHHVGADLRLVETGGKAPPGRAAQLAALPGATGPALPLWRDTLPAGPTGATTEVLALDTAAASEVYRVRPDLADGDVRGLLAGLAKRRVNAPLVTLPAGATRLTGTITGDRSETVAVFSEANGDMLRLPLGGKGRFSVDLPRTSAPLRLSGFSVVASGGPLLSTTWAIKGLATDTGPLSLEGQAWEAVWPKDGAKAVLAGGTLSAEVMLGDSGTVPLMVAAPTPSARVPVVATPQALTALRWKVGEQTSADVGGVQVGIDVVGTIPAVPGTTKPAALLADLPSLSTTMLHTRGVVRTPQEWLVASGADTHAAAAEAAAGLGGLEVLDRRQLASDSDDAYGAGARTALFAAALGAMLLAAVGITVDVRTTARRRLTELAVLHTLGAGSRLLARSLMVEQAFLAGVGVVVGLLVGVGVAATTAPLLILTPSASRPVPTPLLEIDWWRVGGTALLLFLLAVGLSALVGTTLRRRLAVAQLRIGADR